MLLSLHRPRVHDSLVEVAATPTSTPRSPECSLRAVAVALMQNMARQCTRRRKCMVARLRRITSGRKCTRNECSKLRLSAT